MNKNNQSAIIKKTEEHVRSRLMEDTSGHDWWHTHRVRNMALYLGRHEGAALFVVELSALLHDLEDWKFSGGDETAGPRAAASWLQKLEVPESIIEHVCNIIAALSFKGAGVQSRMNTIEGKVVQDADRLDALGAIGIARAFAYGGYKKRPLYDPECKPQLHDSFEEYKKSTSPTVNHFYEKLLLLKDRMNTDKAREIALKRHKYMEQYLNCFFDEWNCSEDE